MNRATRALLEQLAEQHDTSEAARRAWLIVADTEPDDHARTVARERAARCERRLVHLDRLLRRAAA